MYRNIWIRHLAIQNKFFIQEINYNMIDNNTKNDEGIFQLIEEFKENKIKIRKELLKSINSFIACRSTWCWKKYILQ